MCSPLIAVVAVAAIAGTASAYGAYQETRAANKAADKEADILERNAAVSDIQAEDALNRGDLESKQHRLKVKNLKGTQRVAAGASGVLVDSGSTLDVLKDTAVLGELDSLTIRHNASLESFGRREEARGFRSRARLARDSKRSVFQRTAVSLLGGASNVATTSFLAGGRR